MTNIMDSVTRRNELNAELHKIMWAEDERRDIGKETADYEASRAFSSTMMDIAQALPKTSEEIDAFAAWLRVQADLLNRLHAGLKEYPVANAKDVSRSYGAAEAFRIAAETIEESRE